MDYSYSERLHAAQDAALERAYMASLQPPDDYYGHNDGQEPDLEDDLEGGESE